MRAIGMDLGTTNTYVYVVDEAAASPLPVTLPHVSDENGCVATSVLYRDGEAWLVGNVAESEFYAHHAAQNSRDGRDSGHSWVLRSQFKPEIAHGDGEAMRWMTDFLRQLRAALPEGLLTPQTPLHVGMPSRTRADFSLNLGQCFVQAGWPRPVFVRESDAAMISCLQSGVLDIDDIENKALILDFGGGTCDFTILESMDVLQSDGDPLFGGRLFDDLLFQIFCRSSAAFREDVPGSDSEYYIHWIQCKEEKERFSDAAGRDAEARVSLRASWHDARGVGKEAYIHDYTRQDFLRDAENYTATASLLAMLRPYAHKGGLSPQARDLLEGRQIGLLSWFKSILDGIHDRRDVSKVILTGGSSRWFFVADMAREVFPAASCVLSRRSYEDIALGLALYPLLAASRDAARGLLEEEVEPFANESCDFARQVAARHVTRAVRLCTERIVERDIMPVLEAAREKKQTVAQLEQDFAERIHRDTGLTDIIKASAEALRVELEYELGQRFRDWLRQNGVFLAPRVVFSARALTSGFFEAVSVKVLRMGFLNLMDFMATAVLPGIAAYAVGGALAHTGEPVTAVLGGGLAFAGTWGVGKVAKGFLWKQKLPTFFLTEKSRQKIVAKNKAYIERALTKAFEEHLADLGDETERKIRHALSSLPARLTVLNQVARV